MLWIKKWKSRREPGHLEVSSTAKVIGVIQAVTAATTYSLSANDGSDESSAAAADASTDVRNAVVSLVVVAVLSRTSYKE